MKKLLLACSLCLAMLLPVSVAQADIIQNWSYSTDAIFTNMSWNEDPSLKHGVAGSDGFYKYISHNGQSVGGYSKYNWGDSYYTSSSVNVTGASGVVVANGGNVTGLTINHKNMPITTKSLTSGTILTSITLNGDGGKANFNISSTLNFHFIETPNTGNYQNDIFFMTQEEIMKSIGQFTYEGIEYEVSIHTNVKALEGGYLNMAQKALGVSSGTILYGWTTEENQNKSNVFELSLNVSYNPPVVPVPAAVWLMGTGLAGLAALKRRNKL